MIRLLKRFVLSGVVGSSPTLAHHGRKVFPNVYDNGIVGVALHPIVVNAFAV